MSSEALTAVLCPSIGIDVLTGQCDSKPTCAVSGAEVADVR